VLATQHACVHSQKPSQSIQYQLQDVLRVIMQALHPVTPMMSEPRYIVHPACHIVMH
jgi:valyl-tRNA synthetase